MRAKASSKKQATREYKSYPVKVNEFITVSDALGNAQKGVEGINLVTGEPGRFFLTVPKNEQTAEKYKNRPTLEKWSEPFKEFGATKEIKPGAVLFFKDCIPFNAKDDPMGEHFKAIWVDRLGDNPQAVQDRFVRGYMVVEGAYRYEDMVKDGQPVLKEDGSPVKAKILTGGHALSFDYKPDNFISGKPDNEMATQIAAALAAKNNPQLLVRFLDSQNDVCAEVFGSRSWEDPQTMRAPEDAAAKWVLEIENLLKAIPDATSVNIVPAEKYAMSKEGIEKGNIGRAFKEMDFATHHYDGDTRLCNMQQCFGMVGEDDYNNILNKLDSVEKGNKDVPEKDPTLLGGLQYSASFDANMEFLEAASQGDDASHDAEQEPALEDSPAP